MSDMASEIATTLEEAGYSCSLSEFAEGYDGQGSWAYTQIWTDASIITVENILGELEPFEMNNCGHSYDCCGCTFLKSVKLISMYDREGIVYILYESYGINI